MIWVSMDHATFGLAVRDRVVVEAPPIARWTVGRPARWVWDYFAGRGRVLWIA